MQLSPCLPPTIGEILMRVTLPVVLALALVPSSVPAADSGAAPRTPDARVAATVKVLDALDGELQGLETDIERAREVSAQAPLVLRRDLRLLEGRLRRTRRNLIGVDWTQAEPLLARVRRFERTLAQARTSVENWCMRPVAEAAAAPAAMSGTATLAGRVTESDGTTAIAGVTVRAYPEGHNTVWTTTDTTGQWSLQGLDAGTYWVETDYTTGFVDELWDDIQCEGSCDMSLGTPVFLSEGGVVDNIDFALARTATLAGQVSDDATGFPVAGAEVIIYDVRGHYVRSNGVDGNGAWQIQNLTPGLYFALCSSDTHVDELYDGIRCEDPECPVQHGTQIVLVAGETRTDVDFALERAGTISGMVLDDASGLPVSSCDVEVYRSDGRWADDAYVVDGTYEVVGLPAGTYFARTDNWYEWRDQLWDGLPCDPDCDPTQGTPLEVVNGSVTVADFRLVRDPRIAGRVSDAGSGFPMTAEITFYEGGSYAGSTWAESAGWYAGYLGGDGPWTVIARSGSHRDELWDNLPCDPACDPTSGTPVSVPPGTVDDDVSFALDRNGAISGIVGDIASGTGVEGLTVFVYDGAGERVGDTRTTVLGNYFVGDLSPGEYFVRVAPGTANDRSWLGRLYDDLPCDTACDVTGGTQIPVVLSEITEDVDLEVAEAGSLSGRVLDSKTGDPAAGSISVRLYDASGDLVDSAYTNPDGRYRIEGLAPGTYFVTFRDWSYLDELYADIPCEDSCEVTAGTPVIVQRSVETVGIDASLDPLATLHGTVLDAATGLPASAVGYVVVRAYDESGAFKSGDTAARDGSFAIENLPPGTYFVTTSSAWYLDQLWDGLPCETGCDPTAGSPITVTIGEDHGGIDFSLEAHGGISGTVVDATSGAPIGGLWVSLYREDGSYFNSASVSSDGSYVFHGVPDGAYFLTAEDWNYDRQLFADTPCEPSCDVTSGDPVQVARPAVTGGIDFHLTRSISEAGRVSGKVTLAVTGQPLPGVHLWLYDADGDYAGIDISDDAGFFLFGYLPAGTYYLTTSNDFGLIDRLWGGGECEPDCDPTLGAPIEVSAGASVGGVDFALRLPYFTDVWVDHWARPYVESLYAAQVTAGCGVAPLRYCPANPVAREQMAVFLLKADEGGGYVPPAATGMFSDVDPGSPFAPWVEELARRGITAGCGGGMYCPSAPVSREQMAVFLLKTLEGSGFIPPDPTGVFEDVDLESPFAPWIEELVRRAITAGCQADPPLYCPATEVGRDQMGVFLTKTFALPPAQ